jgi:RHS repeat-associated protein
MVTQEIVSAISYNGYGQINQLTYGNGTITDYSYATGNTNKATTLMGSTVLAKEQGASVQTPILSRDYTYNKQGMVRKMIRNVAGSLLSQFGTATFTDTYAYDRFGRLDGHEQLDGSSSIYTLDMDYNKAGSITLKNSNGSSFMNATALTYDLQYHYDPSKDHQLDHIWDPASGATTSFKYNTSGSITQIDDPAQAIPQDFFWNEQQQLTGVKNQQGVHHYIYDHSGERIMKSSLINTTVYLNDQVIDNVTNLDPYTVYVNPYYVVTGLMGGDRVSKHYYMNQQRVATDITINYDPNGGAGGGEYAPSKGLDDLKEVVQELSHEPLDTSVLTLPSLTDYYPETATAKSSNSQAEGAGSSGRILFWYHPDYLGNVDLVTEIDGFAHEFFIYNPWGEEMHQWNANTYAFTSPYRFNSKELDPETGLAYYGARYYQNKMGVWLSVDPLATKYPRDMPYNFVQNNPLIKVDPNGKEVVVLDELSKQNILNTLTINEARFVKFNKNGTLNVRRLNKSESKSENMTALKSLANSDIKYKFKVTSQDHRGEKFVDNNSRNYYHGVTEMPGAEFDPSPDDDVWVLVGDHRVGADAAETTAHEAYGHAYFHELERQGKEVNPNHTYRMEISNETNPMEIELIGVASNVALENQIKLVSEQAIKNYNSRRQ